MNVFVTKKNNSEDIIKNHHLSSVGNTVSKQPVGQFGGQSIERKSVSISKFTWLVLLVLTFGNFQNL